MEMTELAASGGYYVASAGDYVMAEPTTFTGSIGVLMPQLDLTQFGDKYGIHDGSIHSTVRQISKRSGSPLKPETPEQQQYLVNLIDQAFARFKDIVVKGRKNADQSAARRYRQNRQWQSLLRKGSLRLRLNRNDANAYADDVYDQAAKMAGVSRPCTIVRKYEMQPTVWEVLTAKSNINPVQSVTGINVNVDGNSLTELLSPQLMYLCVK